LVLAEPVDDEWDAVGSQMLRLWLVINGGHSPNSRGD